MVKKVVVAGCRHYNNYGDAKKYIDICISNIRKEYKIVFLSGGCTGADELGERYAKENGFEIQKFPADWNIYGKKAGPMRNKRMAEECDYVICFWDYKSRGTRSMIEYAKSLNKPIRILRI